MKMVMTFIKKLIKMKQFKTDEEQFRKFIIKAERLVTVLSNSIKMFNIQQRDANSAYAGWDCETTLRDIENYKKELGMLKHPDAVKSTKYLEVELPLKHH